jgi:deazaflavin-dependent oxidoreductase (nitroreductase family)
VSEEPYLYLTTTGRRSGRPREAELWFTQRAGRYYVIAEDRERAHWIRNLLADPRVSWRIEAQTFTGRARVIEGATGVFVQALSAEKYGWGDGLVVELAPDDPPAR